MSYFLKINTQKEEEKSFQKFKFALNIATGVKFVHFIEFRLARKQKQSLIVSHIDSRRYTGDPFYPCVLDRIEEKAFSNTLANVQPSTVPMHTRNVYTTDSCAQIQNKK